jgi:hypothetical protein
MYTPEIYLHIPDIRVGEIFCFSAARVADAWRRQFLQDLRPSQGLPIGLDPQKIRVQNLTEAGRVTFRKVSHKRAIGLQHFLILAFRRGRSSAKSERCCRAQKNYNKGMPYIRSHFFPDWINVAKSKKNSRLLAAHKSMVYGMYPKATEFTQFD